MPFCILCSSFGGGQGEGKFKMSAGGVTVHLCEKHAKSAYAVMRRRGMIEPRRLDDIPESKEVRT